MPWTASAAHSTIAEQNHNNPAQFVMILTDYLERTWSGVSRSALLGTLLGAAYGLLARLLIETKFAAFFALISISFLILIPFAIGYLAVLPAKNPRWWYRIFVPWIPVATAIGGSIVTGWEGAICVIMSAPLLLIMASVGGLLGGADGSRRPQHAAVIAVLPFLMGPVEALTKAPVRVERNVTETVIDAPASVVWRHVIEVPEITVQEWQGAFYTRIGFPRPLSATLSREGAGGVRRATFAGGVLFLEEVVAWEPERRIAFTIDAQTDSIPPHTLDQHVTIGGRYFDVLDGEYRLEPLDDARTRVILTSRHRVSTTLNVYTSLWARAIMRSIQGSILDVVKRRAEADAMGDRSRGQQRFEGNWQGY